MKIDANKITNETKYEFICHISITPSMIFEPVFDPINSVYITGYKFEGKKKSFNPNFDTNNHRTRGSKPSQTNNKTSQYGSKPSQTGNNKKRNRRDY